MFLKFCQQSSIFFIWLNLLIIRIAILIELWTFSIQFFDFSNYTEFFINLIFWLKILISFLINFMFLKLSKIIVSTSCINILCYVLSTYMIKNSNLFFYIFWFLINSSIVLFLITINTIEFFVFDNLIIIINIL